MQALKPTDWILLFVLFILTVGPLCLRPTFWHPNAERLLALAVLGFAFSFAYPRRLLVILILLAGFHCCFEYLQHFVNYRHATAHDVAIKLAGVGSAVVALFQNLSTTSDSAKATSIQHTGRQTRTRGDCRPFSMEGHASLAEEQHAPMLA
ncbi:hypothetical protein GGQ85_003883 [Nitrobacter vulgaris]|nr:hypothetical protein [Nitrobacter vulgaris]